AAGTFAARCHDREFGTSRGSLGNMLHQLGDLTEVGFCDIFAKRIGVVLPPCAASAIARLRNRRMQKRLAFALPVGRSTAAKKSTTKCPARDFRRHAHRKNAHIWSLRMRRPRNTRQLRAKRPNTKTTVKSTCYLVGTPGFEPGDGGIKIRPIL